MSEDKYGVFKSLDEKIGSMLETTSRFDAVSNEVVQFSNKQNIKKNIIAGIAIAIAIAIIAIMWVTVIKPSLEYKNAQELMATGKYSEAYFTFKALGDYKDSIEKAEELSFLVIKNAKIGDTVGFGRYEQQANEDDNETFKVEPLEWYVIDTNGEEKLLLSKYVISISDNLDCRSWKDSNIREELNDFYYGEMFNEKEKECIIEKTLKTNTFKNQGTGLARIDGNVIVGSQSTKDKVFLLSKEECDTLKKKNADMIKGYYTPYAEYAAAAHDEEYCYEELRWVLRSNAKCTVVRSNGDSVTNYCLAEMEYEEVEQENVYSYVLPDLGCYSGIRPAVWVRIK